MHVCVMRTYCETYLRNEIWNQLQSVCVYADVYAKLCMCTYIYDHVRVYTHVYVYACCEHPCAYTYTHTSFESQCVYSA